MSRVMMKRRLVLAAPLGLVACGSILPVQKFTPTVDWPLDPQPPSMMAPNAAGPVLLVRDLSAAPGLDDTGLHSLRADGSLDISYYNRWSVPPANAATAALANWALASGDFAAVVGPGSRLTANLIVEGELAEFYADLSTGQAHAVLTLVIIRNSFSIAAVNRPLAQQRINGTAPLRGTDAAALVAAQLAALASALTQAMTLLNRLTA